MTEAEKKARLAAATKALDEVQAAVYALLKPHGFRKHGRVLHRFVDGDISQVVEFQRGQAYREETHLFWVRLGIRIPECELRSFLPEEDPKKYYHDDDCNLRWTLGDVSKKKDGTFNLHKPNAPMVENILVLLKDEALPMFEQLSSREAIMERQCDYPKLGFDHLYLLEHAMIFGRRGDIAKATELFKAHYRGDSDPEFARKHPDAHRGHQVYLRELAEKLGIEIDENTPEA